MLSHKVMVNHRGCGRVGVCVLLSAAVCCRLSTIVVLVWVWLHMVWTPLLVSEASRYGLFRSKRVGSTECFEVSEVQEMFRKGRPGFLGMCLAIAAAEKLSGSP